MRYAVATVIVVASLLLLFGCHRADPEYLAAVEKVVAALQHDMDTSGRSSAATNQMVIDFLTKYQERGTHRTSYFDVQSAWEDLGGELPGLIGMVLKGKVNLTMAPGWMAAALEDARKGD